MFIPSRTVGRFALFFWIFAFLLGVFVSIRHAPPVTSDLYYEKPDHEGLIYHHSYATGPRVTADAAILVEAKTGTILYAKNEHQRRAPASTTKIMTALVALERGNLADVVTVSRRAASVGGSSLWLRPGEKITLEELIRGTMVRSGNDGATAIAEHIAGSVSEFVELMNLKAAQIGALNTRFRNPHGLSAVGHYSTAYDLALMCRHGLRNPKFAEIVSTREHWSLDLESMRQRHFQNTNRLLWSFEGADGVKTGTTSEAGYCLAASATRDGMQLIAVVLHSDNRWADAARLLEYGFANFTRLTLVRRGEVVARTEVKNGMEPSVGLVASRDLDVVVSRAEAERVSVTVEVDPAVVAPVRPTMRIGRAAAFFDGEELADVGLFPQRAVPRRTLFRILARKLWGPGCRVWTVAGP